MIKDYLYLVFISTICSIVAVTVIISIRLYLENIRKKGSEMLTNFINLYEYLAAFIVLLTLGFLTILWLPLTLSLSILFILAFGLFVILSNLFERRDDEYGEYYYRDG